MSNEDELKELKAENARLLKALKESLWLSIVVYLHYDGKTDLNPIQEKHLEISLWIMSMAEKMGYKKHTGDKKL